MSSLPVTDTHRLRCILVSSIEGSVKVAVKDRFSLTRLHGALNTLPTYGRRPPITLLFPSCSSFFWKHCSLSLLPTPI